VTPTAGRSRCPAAVGGHEVLAEQVDYAEGGLPVALELADHSSGVQVVAADQAQPLGQHPEVDAMVLLPVEDRVQGAVNVQQHAVSPAPARQRGVRREPGRLPPRRRNSQRVTGAHVAALVPLPKMRRRRAR
jgi:hypothetical protein